MTLQVVVTQPTIQLKLTGPAGQPGPTGATGPANAIDNDMSASTTRAPSKTAAKNYVDAAIAAIPAATTPTLTALGITAAAQTILDDTTIAAIRATLGAAVLGKFETMRTATASTTAILADAGGLVAMQHASNAMTFTVPLNATIPYDIGTVICILQSLAGQVTVAGAGGVSVNAFGGALKGAGAAAFIWLVKTSTDIWYATGQLTT